MRLWSQIFSNKAAVPFFFVFTPRATVPCGSRPAGVRRFLVSPRVGRAAPAAPTGSWCWCPRPQTRHPDPGWPRGAATLRKSPFLLRCRRPSPGGDEAFAEPGARALDASRRLWVLGSWHESLGGAAAAPPRCGSRPTGQGWVSTGQGWVST